MLFVSFTSTAICIYSLLIFLGVASVTQYVTFIEKNIYKLRDENRYLRTTRSLPEAQTKAAHVPAPVSVPAPVPVSVAPAQPILITIDTEYITKAIYDAVKEQTTLGHEIEVTTPAIV
jgi:hypothetical protein